MAVVADQCEFGLTSKDKWGRAPAMKPTRFMTNSEWVGNALDRRCQNMWRKPIDRHRHVQLIGGRRASEAQVYPRKLCEAIVEGIQRQIECDEWGVVKVKINSVKPEGEEKAPRHDEDEFAENTSGM